MYHSACCSPFSYYIEQLILLNTSIKGFVYGIKNDKSLSQVKREVKMKQGN